LFICLFVCMWRTYDPRSEMNKHPNIQTSKHARLLPKDAARPFSLSGVGKSLQQRRILPLANASIARLADDKRMRKRVMTWRRATRKIRGHWGAGAGDNRNEQLLPACQMVFALLPVAFLLAFPFLLTKRPSGDPCACLVLW